MWFYKFVVIVCFALCVLDADSKSTGKGGHETKNHKKESTNSDDIDVVTDLDDTKIPDVDGFSDRNQTKNRTKESKEPNDIDGVSDRNQTKNRTKESTKPDDNNWFSFVDKSSDLNDNTTKAEDANEGLDRNSTATTPDTEDFIHSSDLWGKINDSSVENNSTGQYNISRPDNTTQTSTNATPNATQCEIPQNSDSQNSTTSQNTTQQANKASIGYWIPIFNFGNDFYFGTNKGYAKLVNFPAPLIYSFLPVGAKQNSPFSGGPTMGQPRQENVYGGNTEQNSPFYGTPTMGEPRQEYEYSDSTGNYFDNEPNFSDCYVNMELGNMIPYSYFGNWVPVFNLQNGWHLETYEGFVPLDMSGFEVPLTYEFVPIVYRYSNVPSVVEQKSQQSQNSADPGLAQWYSPVVMKD